MNVPSGFTPLTDAGAFVEHVGSLYERADDGVIGARVEARHLNVAGTAMGGFLATLVDVGVRARDPRRSGGGAGRGHGFTDYGLLAPRTWRRRARGAGGGGTTDRTAGIQRLLGAR